MRALPYTLLFVAAATANGQMPTRTFHLDNVHEAAALNEIGTILRVVGDITKLTWDDNNSAITVTGTDGQMQTAAWVIKRLDSPAHESGQFTVPDTNDVVNILYLLNTPTIPELNEVLTTLRAVADIQRIFTFTSAHAIVMRTPANQAPMALWLAHQVDVAPGESNLSQTHEFAEPDKSDQVVKVDYVAYPGQQANLNEMVTVLRTIVDIRAIFTRTQPQGIAFRGTTAQVQLADWLMQNLDLEPGKQPKEAKQYPAPSTSDSVTRIYYLANAPNNAALNGVITAIRTVADVQRIFSCTALHAVIIRASADKADLTSWLVRQMDIAPDDKNRWQPHEYPLAGKPDQVVKVDYLIHATPQYGLNEIVTVLRTVADIQRIFTRTEPQSFAFKGTTAQVQLAEWLFQQLDVDQPDAGLRNQKHEYIVQGVPDNVVRVYYLKSTDTPARMNEIVTAIRVHADVRRIFTCSEPRAIALRGNAEAIATADQIIKEQEGVAAQ